MESFTPYYNPTITNLFKKKIRLVNQDLIYWWASEE